MKRKLEARSHTHFLTHIHPLTLARDRDGNPDYTHFLTHIHIHTPWQVMEREVLVSQSHT